MNDVTITMKGEKNTAEGKTFVTYKGKLSASVSFIEWNLAGRQKYSDTLVFVVPDTAQGIRCEFGGAALTPAAP